MDRATCEVLNIEFFFLKKKKANTFLMQFSVQIQPSPNFKIYEGHNYSTH